MISGVNQYLTDGQVLLPDWLTLCKLDTTMRSRWFAPPFLVFVFASFLRKLSRSVKGVKQLQSAGQPLSFPPNVLSTCWRTAILRPIFFTAPRQGDIAQDTLVSSAPF